MLLSSKDYVIVVQAETALVIVHTRVHVRHVTAERCRQEPSLALGLLRRSCPTPRALAPRLSPLASRSPLQVQLHTVTHTLQLS